MNNRQKELLKHQLKSEKEILSELKKIYESSLSEIDEKIQILLSDELTQSKIYRVEYQKALKGQVSAILENLNNNQYESVSDYLKDCYEDGFIGTLYDLQGQGIPLIFPINQEEIVEAIILDSKISEGLYTKMGNNVSDLKKRISSEISRGISTASPYAEIARNIRSHANITVNQSMRIVRTEGNRIHNRSALDAALKAKARGADTVKVWDATLDGVTRPHHRQLDGQVRELEEDFEVDGLTACAPLNFGVAAEDCNCRCVLLTKPRWDLDGAFTKRNNETGELMHFDNVKDYYDFKQKYWDYIDKSGGSAAIPKVLKSEFVPAKSIEEAQKYAQKYVKSYFGDKTFKGDANFKGISIDNANEINRALTDIFDNYGFPKISGIKPIDPLSAKGKKIFSSADAVMAYSPVEHGVYINKNVLKNNNTLTDYHKNSSEAWETVMDNIDKLSGPQKELALRYKEAGRTLVGDGSAYDYFVHEIGHHIEWEVFDAKTNNLIGNGMKEYAGKISGYATSSKSEYFAESFSAFVKGEYNKLDPEYIEFIRLYDLSIKNK